MDIEVDFGTYALTAQILNGYYNIFREKGFIKDFTLTQSTFKVERT